ncbi:MAG: hypothetical protein V4463_11815 [Pseudomonadota bacterium]
MADGLSNTEEIEALADQLSQAADQIHARIMRDIKAGKGDQDTARQLLDDELVLRQRANGLYADAATYVVKALGRSQQQVLALTTAAAAKLARITRLADGLGLVAAMAALAGAAATGQPAPILLALEKLHHAIDSTRPA